ncbi:MAG: hypothetical protein HC810_05555, partial [Acaryochloridaceae cyanobacterium RL_2_7]|nr:hypothetical protein [Acaryochloridaceae cyanobacterium RL_2_7]
MASAQAAFLPIPKQGIAQFNPVLFNYQSYEDNPAVLTLLATREGTSVTVIDNKRDGFEAGSTWGQRLFFNKNGERASFTGQRISDFQADGNSGGDRSSSTSEEEEAGLNMVMLIQVPLKQQARAFGSNPMGDMMMLESAPMPSAAMEKSLRSDVEEAVIGHGEV